MKAWDKVDLDTTDFWGIFELRAKLSTSMVAKKDLELA